jgi:hypothetical protein
MAVCRICCWKGLFTTIPAIRHLKPAGPKHPSADKSCRMLTVTRASPSSISPLVDVPMETTALWMVPLSPPRGWLNGASPLHVKLLGTECPSTMANRANRKGAGAGVKHWECDLCHCRYNSAASSTCEICKAPRPRVKFALCVDGRYFLCKLHTSSFEGCVKVREISTGSKEAISSLSIIETDGTVEESIVDAVSLYMARGQPAGLEGPGGATTMGSRSVNPVTK